MEFELVDKSLKGFFRKIQFTRADWNLVTARLFEDRKLDLYLGFQDYSQLPGNLRNANLNFMKGLGVHHLVLNLKNKILQNKEFRHDLSRLIKHFARTDESLNKVFLPVDQLALGRLVPIERNGSANEIPFNQAQFVNKWRGKFKNGRLVLACTYGELTESSLQNIRQALAEADIVFSHNFEKRFDIVKDAISEDFDLEFSNYIAPYPRPEVFINVLFSTPSFIKDTKDFKKMESFKKQILDVYGRKDYTEYPKSIQEIYNSIQRENWIIPMFEFRVPFVISSRIYMPDSSFQYNLDFRTMRARSL